MNATVSKTSMGVAAAFVLGFAALPATAAVVNFTTTGSTGVPVGYGVDVGSATWSTAPSIVDGSLGGSFRSPYDELGAPGTPGYSDYFTVGSPTLQASPAVLIVNVARYTFSMLWGSVDTYNAVTFCDSANTTCVTVTGSQIAAAAPANFGTGNAVVNFTADFAFSTISFVSDFGRIGDRPAFEFAVAAVPVPAGGLLLLGALGGLAALRRRKALAV